MLNFIAGVRPSSPAPSSPHLAISSQHMLGQAHMYKAMGNLEEAKRWYENAVEKAKTEREKNPDNLQTKRIFDAMRNELFTFLKELPLSERQGQGTVANFGEQNNTSTG